MRKRPMCQAAAVFVLGLLSVCMVFWAWLVIFGLFVLLGLYIFRKELSCCLRRRQAGRLLTGGCIFLLVFWSGVSVMQRASAVTDLQNVSEGSQITVTGTIVDYTFKNDMVIFYIRSTSRYHLVMVSMDSDSYLSYLQKNISENTSENKSENISENISEIKSANDIREGIGMVICATGTKSSFTEPTNPGQFHQKLYYKGLNVDFQVRYAQISAVSGNKNMFMDGLKRLQGTLSQQLYLLTDEKTGSILSAMLFGDKTMLDSDVKALYQRNGIAHVLAISGLHISILGMCIYRLLRKIGWPVQVSCVCGSLFTVCFGLMTGMPVSAMRAVVMYSVSIGALMTGRTYDMPSAISLAGILVLLDKPYALFQASMQLSFGAVLALSFLPEKFPKLTETEVLQKLFYRQLLEEKNVQQEEHGRRTVRQCRRVGFVLDKMIQGGLQGIDYCLEGLAGSLTIQLAIMPLQLYHFFYIPVYSGLLNIIVIPAMSVILLFGMGAVLCSFLPLQGAAAAISQICLMPCRLLLLIYERACFVTESLPGNLLCFGQPALWQIFLFYVFFSIGMIGLKKLKIKYAVFPVLLLFFGVGMLCPMQARGMTITMLDVGQGESICMQLPDGTTLLSDGGSTDVSKVGTYRIKPFLLSKGISVVDAILVSHWDEDHISGIEELLEENGQEITIKTIFLPDVPASADEELEAFVLLAQEAGVNVQYVKAGDVMQIGQVAIQCLAPASDLAVTDRNECSMVFTLSYGEFRMLFTGDLPQEQEETFLDSDLLSCQVLKVAHHGSQYSTSETFLSKVQPVLSLISCGSGNSYGHPHSALLERLTEAGSAYYVTAEEGAICLRVRKDGRYRLLFGQDSILGIIFKQ